MIPLLFALGGAGLAAALWAAWHGARRGQHQARIADDVRALLGKGTNDLLWTWQPDSGGAWFGQRWEDVLGVAPGPADDLGRWLARVHPQDHPALLAGLDALKAGRSERFSLMHRIVTRDTSRWVNLTAVAGATAGGQRLLAGGLADITEQIDTEERLTHDAFHDALTSLPNRALLLDRLGHCVARARRSPGYHFALLFLDLDGFKFVNDSLGHAFGDLLLGQIGQRLARSVRPGDTVARMGGDEFVVLVDPINDGRQAEEVAERLLASLADRFVVQGQEVTTAASIGVALSSREYRTPDEMVRDADTAMYRAKSTGKARYCVFDSTMHELAVERLRQEKQLRDAMTNGTLVVHYQPIVGLADGRVVGFEALARLIHPDGYIGPDQFIPVAEETGLIKQVTRLVVTAVVEQAARWRDQGADVYVSVNVSARDLRDRELHTTLRELLARHTLDPRLLELELTESTLVDAVDQVNQPLSDLRALGLRICIDDFGTGYSSLSYLHRFAIDRLKLDRSFVSALGGTRAPGIVRTVLDLSRSLGIPVTAEGVETPAQLTILRELGCGAAQGWLFGRAVPAEQASAFLQRRFEWETVG